MRGALGKDLTNIPISVLNNMVSKDVAMNLRKFKMNAGNKTTSNRSKSRGDQEKDDDKFVRKNSRGKSNDDGAVGSLTA
jgi:hypothetical protein